MRIGGDKEQFSTDTQSTVDKKFERDGDKEYTEEGRQRGYRFPPGKEEMERRKWNEKRRYAEMAEGKKAGTEKNGEEYLESPRVGHGRTLCVGAHSDPIIEGSSGHACGHNLLGTGCLGAALAVGRMLHEGNLQGTIRYYGCPAEERIGGKIKMMEAGAFEGADCCIAWHPDCMNKIIGTPLLAVTDVDFEFSGVTSYITAAEKLGGNALSAVDLMNVGIQFLRQHLNDSYRIDTCLLKGAQASNVFPDTTRVTYGLRAADKEQCVQLRKRVVEIAEGAAKMSGTRVTATPGSTYENFLYNKILGGVVLANMKEAEKQEYSEEEERFAEEIAATVTPEKRRGVLDYFGVPEEAVRKGMCRDVVFHETADFLPSSDVGNVSRPSLAEEAGREYAMSIR